MAALRAAVRADKKAYVASVLKLTDAEAKKFWPVYDAYQRDLDLANQRRNMVIVEIVGTNKPISDLYAKNLANELIAADAAEVAARQKINNRLIKPLPGRRIMPVLKAARYLQLESKIRAIQALRHRSKRFRSSNREAKGRTPRHPALRRPLVWRESGRGGSACCVSPACPSAPGLAAAPKPACDRERRSLRCGGDDRRSDGF